MLSVVILNVIVLSVVMLSVIMLSVIILSVIMLGVVAPSYQYLTSPSVETQKWGKLEIYRDIFGTIDI